MTTVALDIEIIHSVQPPFSFDRPWELGVGVAATYCPEQGCREWFGGGEKPAWGSSDVFRLFAYLTRFERIITFNGLKFDYWVMNGYLDPLWRFTDGRAIAGPTDVMGKVFAGRSIDLFLDLYETLGRRVGLDAVMRGTLGVDKQMDGSLAPAKWRNGERYAVIGYCRDDTQRAYEIYRMGEETGQVAYRYGEKKNDVKVAWKVR